MATLLHSDSRRLYSWWWDSHISPKNSKWLQENLTDMDAKVKAMIKLIEEDADSFARRAEMYYKKRPDLMKLVEEFYRAYRALAERYDHATGELRHAHRTMAEAFPDHVSLVLTDDSPLRSAQGTDPHTPERSSTVRALFGPENGSYSGDSNVVVNKKGLKQLYEMFGSGEVESCNINVAEGKLSNGMNDKEEKKDMEGSLHKEVLLLSNENENLKTKVLGESERAVKAESEVQSLMKALTDMQAEKESVLSQYQQSLEKLANLEGELFDAEMDSSRLKERASKAESEFFASKEAIIKLEAERDSSFVKNKDFLERISSVEIIVSRAQEDAKVLDERSIRAEIESQYLKNELLRLESEKEAGLLHYGQCLEKMSDLAKKVFVAEEDARCLTQQAEKAESEVEKLRVKLAEVTAQKEAAILQYNLSLKKITQLEDKLSSAKEEIRHLNSAIVAGTTKLSNAEGKSDLFEKSNQTLRLEAENLVKQIASKYQELSKKHGELEKLQICVQDERSRYDQVEATLQTLQNMYSQSQEEQRILALELKNRLQMLSDIEMSKHDLEKEIQQMKDENQSLNELNSTSTLSMRDLKNEILELTRMKARVEEEVSLQLSRSNILHQEIQSLKDEINGLNKSYLALVKQVELVGLDPKCVGASVKELQDENSRLRQIHEEHRDEKETLSKKLVNMEELVGKNAALQRSLSETIGALQVSQEMSKVLQESCHVLQGEKSALVAEKSVLFSQLQIVTDNMQKLLEKNSLLEKSLCSANVELEDLTIKSKSLEEFCQLLGDEKASLVNERSALAGQLETVERRLESLEVKFKEFEVKYAGLEKEKETTQSKLEELRASFGVEKQERATLTQRSESRLSSLENHVHLLQEENRRRKKEFQEELDKAVISQFEIFILQQFVEDMKEKNYLLLAECQKQIKAGKLTEKLVSELENENLEQQVETELLLVEVEKLRLGIYQVFKALEYSDRGSEETIENLQVFVHHILEDIADMKHSLSKYTDDKHQLVVENLVLLTLLGQVRLEGLEVESEMSNLDEAFKTLTKQLLMVQNEKHELHEMNGKLRSEVSMGKHHADRLMADVESLNMMQAGMQSDYFKLQEEYSQVLEENRTLFRSFSDLKEEKCIVDEENNTILLEMLTFCNLSAIFESFRSEKAAELEMLSEDLHQRYGVNNELEKEVQSLINRLGLSETDNLLMIDVVQKLEMELSEARDLNHRLKQETSSGVDSLSLRDKEISDAKQKLIKAENLNFELRQTVEGVKKELEKSEFVQENLEVRILKLSEDITNQNREIQCLVEVKGELETELGKLNEENEERRIREENLNSELQENRKEIELWDAEASSFYFDLQLSSIREVLFEDKVHELVVVCESLQDECASKTLVIEQMSERVSFSENEIGELKSQLLAYTPAIDSLKDNIESLEHSMLSRAMLVKANCQTPKDEGLIALTHENVSQEMVEDNSFPVPDGVLDLQKLQNRIKAVENVLMEETNKMSRQVASRSNSIKLRSAVRKIASLKSKGRPVQQIQQQKEDERRLWDKPGDNRRLQKSKPEHPEAKNGILIKDIPLDQVSDSSLYGRSRRGNNRADEQMLVLWDTADDDHNSIGQNPIELKIQNYEATEEDIVFNQFDDADERSWNPSSELEMERELGVDKLQVSASKSMPNRGSNKKKTLEKLASDGVKLANIQTTVHDLRRKLETFRKSRNAKNVDLETVKEQLQKVEETALHLFDLNVQMTREIEDIQFSSKGKGSSELDVVFSVQRKRVAEQARKESQKIGRLQLEIQKIQYVMLKLEEETKSKGKNRFSRTKSRTTVILRDFIHSGKRNSFRGKKARMCGCFKPSTRGEANNNNI